MGKSPTTKRKRLPIPKPGEPRWFVYQVLLLLASVGGSAYISTIVGFVMGTAAVMRTVAAITGCIAWLVALVLGYSLRSDIQQAKLRRVWWTAGVLLLLLWAITVIYLPLLYSWTIPFEGDRYVAGSVVTEGAQQYIEEQGKEGKRLTREKLLFDFGGQIELVWADLAIRRIIVLSAFGTLFLFLVVFTSILLAELAPVLAFKRSTDTAGETESEDSKEGDAEK